MKNINTKNTIVIENKVEINSNELEDELRYDILGSELTDKLYNQFMKGKEYLDDMIKVDIFNFLKS